MIDGARYSRILPASQFYLLNFTLGIGHFLVLLNAGAYLPMLPYVAGTMGEGIPYVVWGQSDYFTAMGAAFLIARPLMKRFGPKNVAISAYLAFSMASLFALFTIQSFPVYTSVRVLQGFSAGLSIIPSFFLLLEYYRQDKQHVATSLWGLAVFVPFSVGPVLGGWLAYRMGDWRLLFVFSFLVALSVAGILWALLADWEDETDPSFSLKRPVKAFLFLVTSALLLQEYFDVGLLSDLSSRFRELWWLLFACAFFAWLFWSENSRFRLVNFSLFSKPNFASGMLLLCLAFMMVQGAIVQYIIRIQVVEGYTAWHVGLLFLPLFLFSKPLSIFVQHRISKGMDPRIPAFLSILMLAGCFFWISEYVRPAPWEKLLPPQFLMGAALGLFFASMTAISLSHVPKGDLLHGVDLLNTARNLCAGLAITFSDIGWDRLSDYEIDRIAFQQDANAAKLLEFAPHLVHKRLDLEAQLVTFNDFFRILSIALLALAVAVWLLSPSVSKDPDMAIVENLGEEP